MITQRSLHKLFILFALAAMTAQAAEYTVAPGGDDAAAGTRGAPWRTLAHACDVAAPGDTVVLRAGVYRETLKPRRSGEFGRPIRFEAAAGEKVVLSGAEPLVGTWQQHKGRIFALKTALTFKQLFADNTMLPEARWPNSPPEDLMTYNRAVTENGTGYEMLADAHLPSGN